VKQKHPHAVLGVHRDADFETITQAYITLAKTAHPDAGGSKEDFIRLQSAYDAMTKGHTPAGTDAAEGGCADSERWEFHEDIMKAVWDRVERNGECHPTPVTGKAEKLL